MCRWRWRRRPFPLTQKYSLDYNLSCRTTLHGMKSAVTFAGSSSSISQINEYNNNTVLSLPLKFAIHVRSNAHTLFHHNIYPSHFCPFHRFTVWRQRRQRCVNRSYRRSCCDCVRFHLLDAHTEKHLSKENLSNSKHVCQKIYISPHTDA